MSSLSDSPNPSAWQDRRVLITGHTGFKGSWLATWVSDLGAIVHGVALPPPTQPSAFEALGLERHLTHQIGDIRELPVLEEALARSQPEVVFHLAAQPFVRLSYRDPVVTFQTNVMGTVNVLEAVRRAGCVKVVVVVTSDKCYENREWPWGYRENDPLGGRDPYSASKACAEIVTSSYRSSFLTASSTPPTVLASARAGNVVGGGDWGEDRIVPDAIRAFVAGVPLRVRNPDAVRPWQHVLDPLRGYLMLAERGLAGDSSVAEAWNFGPDEGAGVTVAALADALIDRWGNNASWSADAAGGNPHEAHSLTISAAKAQAHLGWRPRVPFGTSLDLAVEWYRAHHEGAGPDDMYALTTRQLAQFGGEG
jgi:CDP-glucose 4,6-dehydratase